MKAYTTNAPDRPRNAFVDIHGKIVATADQFLISSEEALVVIEAPFEERLHRHLAPYLFLYGAEIFPSAYRVYFDLESAHRPAADETAIAQKAGQLILSPRELPASVSEEAFRLFRVRNRIPLQGVDYDEDILLNVADEEYISYDKGCYLGQEIIARIHFRGKPSKKLLVKAEDECPEADRARLSSRVWDAEKGRFFGFLMAQND